MPAFDDVEGCALVGMVHLLPLPGSPGWQGDMARVRRRAVADAEVLLSNGCDAVIVENMGDLPYMRGRVAADTLAAMTLCVSDVVALGGRVGIQVPAGANSQALSIAGVAGASFIRAEAFAYGHLADEGWLEACAGPLLRQRATDGLPACTGVGGCPEEACRPRRDKRSVACRPGQGSPILRGRRTHRYRR